MKANRITAIIAATAAISLFLTGCGGGGASAPPVLPQPSAPAITFTTPQNGASMSEIDFRHESFQISMTYSGASPMNAATLAVTLKMDAAASQSITQYFTVSGKTIASAGSSRLSQIKSFH